MPSRLPQTIRRLVLPLIGAVLLAGALTEVVTDATRNGWPSQRPTAIVIAVFATAPVALAARFPLAVATTLIVAAGAAIGAVEPKQGPFEPFLAMVVALFFVGLRVAGTLAVLPLAVVLAGEAAVSVAGINGGAGNNVPAVIFLTVAWLVGRVMRSRTLRTRELEQATEQLTAEREERERTVVLAERARIARELHDVVAHNVSVVVVHAQAAKRSVCDADETLDELNTIETVGRQTIDELRRLLGILRRDEELALTPPPSLVHLDLLAASLERAGLRVVLRLDGVRGTVPAGVDVAAYRIVQECLTNVLKHSGAQHACVEVRYDNDRVELEVHDPGPAKHDTGDGGQGLIGMRERVTLYGGSLHAGADGHGYRVHATLPYHSPLR